MHRTRFVISQMLWDTMHDAWQLYFPDMSFPDAILATIMLWAIFIAETRKAPHTRYTLAKEIGMPAETTRKHVKRMIASGIVSRDAKFYLHASSAVLGSARALAAVRRIRKRVIKTAGTLVRLGPPKMGA